MENPQAPKFNTSNLYEVKTYTDAILGTITHNIPIAVFEHGVHAIDSVRRSVFAGNTVLHTTNGPLNITFPIEAESLWEAAANFNVALQNAIEEMQTRQLRNKIITGGGPINNNKKQ